MAIIHPIHTTYNSIDSEGMYQKQRRSNLVPQMLTSPKQFLMFGWAHPPKAYLLQSLKSSLPMLEQIRGRLVKFLHSLPTICFHDSELEKIPADLPRFSIARTTWPTQSQFYAWVLVFQLHPIALLVSTLIQMLPYTPSQMDAPTVCVGWSSSYLISNSNLQCFWLPSLLGFRASIMALT